MTGPETVFGVKVATIATSAIAAAIAIFIEWPRYTLGTALGSFFAGVFVGAIATEATLEFLNLSGNSNSWGYAVAGAYGITGRNLILWLQKVSNDPPEFLRSLIGIWKGRDR